MSQDILLLLKQRTASVDKLIRAQAALNAKVQALELEKTELAQQNQSLRTEISTKDETIRDLKTKIKYHEEQTISHRADNSTKDESNRRLKKRIADCEQQIQSLQQDTSTKDGTIQSLLTKLSETNIFASSGSHRIFSPKK